MLINIMLLIGTGVIAFHSLTWRDEEGESDWVRLLFGCIALIFFFRFLLADILGLWVI